MKNISKQLIFVMVWVFILSGGLVKAEEYKLGPGDVLDISVWGHDELSVSQEAGTTVASSNGSSVSVPHGLLIRPDGKISFPLAGEITAAGLTTGQLTEVLNQGLSEYLVNPKVTVNVVKFRTTRVYVLGEVPKPGMYELDKQHNLLDAIGVAGGYTQYAAKKEVLLVRNGQSGYPPQKINLLRLLKTGDMSQNVPLNEGDVVYLSSSGKVDFARDILPFMTGAYYLGHTN